MAPILASKEGRGGWMDGWMEDYVCMIVGPRSDEMVTMRMDC